MQLALTHPALPLPQPHPIPLSPSSLSSTQLYIQQRYRAWRKNAPHLYNTIYSQHLTWPTLTTQWLPQNKLYKSDCYSTNRIIYATNASNQQQNYLIVGKIKFPYYYEKTQEFDVEKMEKAVEEKEYRQVFGLLWEYQEPYVQVFAMMKHDGQINRARYNPFDPTMLASKSSNKNIYLFNYIQHSKEGKAIPNSLKLTLVGHTDEGFGLSWNQNKKEGMIASGSNDGKVLVWDIGEAKETIQPTYSFQHDTPVNDVCFHKKWCDILASVDDDGIVNFWDLRDKRKMGLSGKHQDGQIYTFDFSKSHQHLYTTGGSCSTVNIWDIRMQRQVYQSLHGHKKDITKIEFSNTRDNIVWSASNDTRLIEWDLALEGKINDEEKATKFSRFVHAGHRKPITQFNIHPSDDSKIVSADENNELHVFDPYDKVQ